MRTDGRGSVPEDKARTCSSAMLDAELEELADWKRVCEDDIGTTQRT